MICSVVMVAFYRWTTFRAAKIRPTTSDERRDRKRCVLTEPLADVAGTQGATRLANMFEPAR